MSILLADEKDVYNTCNINDRNDDKNNHDRNHSIMFYELPK